MNREQVIEKFAALGSDSSSGQVRLRGDGCLNPGMERASSVRLAAVLIPLVDRPGGLRLLLTTRTEHLLHHPGQISFPGGVLEPGESPESAAIRETEEEIGLARSRVQLIGRLDGYETRTGFHVIPLVGLVHTPFTLKADPFEVADIFEVPLDFLLDPANHRRHSRWVDGRKRAFYALPYGDKFIWGATAGMMINLYEFLTA